MKNALLLAAAAGSLLISSAPPRPQMPVEEGVGYPPCSRILRDRCIQLHERGVATPENLAINADDQDEGEGYAGGPPPPGAMPPRIMPQGTSEMDSVVAAPPPTGEMRMAMNDYPPCSAAMGDRCTQQRIVVIRQHERLLRLGERG